MNLDWCIIYPNARVTYLPRCHSDHCPVLMEALPVSTVKLIRPFRFQEFWLSEISFPTIVSKAWNGNRELAESIDCFSKDATAQNRNHFGNIHQRKKKGEFQLEFMVLRRRCPTILTPLLFVLRINSLMSQRLFQTKIVISGC